MYAIIILFMTLWSWGATSGIPFNSLKGTAERVGVPYVAPGLGAALLETGVLPNIRFMGNFEPGYNKDGVRDYQKDKSKDPIWNIVFLLFPSNAGEFQAFFKGDRNIAFNLDNISPSQKVSVMVDLLAYSTLARMGQDNNPSFMQGVFQGPKNQNLRINLRKLMEAIKESIELESNPHSIYPKGFPEQILTAFFVNQFKEEELSLFLEEWGKFLARDRGLLSFAKDHKEESKNIDVLFECVAKKIEVVAQLIPYMSSTLISNGNCYIYNRRENTLEKEEPSFADCGETALRHLLNFILYRPSTRTIALPKEIHPTAYTASVTAFLEKQGVSNADNGDINFRSDWNKVVGDLNRGGPPSRLGPIVYNEEKRGAQFNLKCGLLNLVGVLERLFGVPLPVGSPGEDFAQVQKWFHEFFTKLISLLHPGLRVHIEISDFGKVENDFAGTVSFKLLETPLSFVLKARPGHADMILSGFDQLPAVPLPDLLPSPAVIPRDSTTSLLFQGNPSSRQEVSLLYRLLEKNMVNNSMAQIAFLKEVVYDEFAQRVRPDMLPFGSFVINAFRHFPWEDLWAVGNLVLSLPNYSNPEHFPLSFRKIFYKKAQFFEFDKNLGLLDQFEALRYVKFSNIRAAELNLTAFAPHLQQVREISITGGSFSKITGLEGLPSLQSVKLANISFLEFFHIPKEASQWKCLNLRNLDLQALTGMENLSSIKEVRIFRFHGANKSNSGFTLDKLGRLQVGPLLALLSSSWKDIVTLEVNQLPPGSLTVSTLEGLTSLRRLTIVHSSLEKLPLESWPHLEHLYLQNLPLTELDFTRCCPELKEVFLVNIPKLSKLVGLERLPHLTLLHLAALPLINSDAVGYLIRQDRPWIQV
jgi:hypothetical protein